MNPLPRPSSLLSRAILVLSLLVPGAFGQTAGDGDRTVRTATPLSAINFTPMAPRDRFHRYLKVTFSPTSFLGSAFGAAIGQWKDLPYEWGQGGAGYGRRYASSFAHHIVNTTLEYGLSSALHEDNRYFRSNRKGLKARSWYIVESTFLARKDDGTRRFSYSRMGAIVGSSLLARTWQPHSNRKLVNVTWNSLSSYGIAAAFNAAREFWPRKR